MTHHNMGRDSGWEDINLNKIPSHTRRTLTHLQDLGNSVSKLNSRFCHFKTRQFWGLVFMIVVISIIVGGVVAYSSISKWQAKLERKI